MTQHKGNGTNQTRVEISKARFICFFLRKLHGKTQIGLKTEGEGTPLGQASPQSHHLYNHYSSYLFTISTEMEVTQKRICKRGEADNL